MKRFETEWSGYRAIGVSPKADVIQLRETKRAFYAGASSVISILGSLFNPAEGVEPTDEDCKVLEEVWKELDDFFKETVEEDKKVINIGN